MSQPDEIQRKRILDVLETGESIRLVDGRYSNGFVDTNTLNEMLKTGEVEVYTHGGVRFVKKEKGKYVPDL